MPDVYLLTESRYERPGADARADPYVANILREDELLAAALGALGLTCERVDWARPDVPWERARCALFRTTWDYFDDVPRFRAWLDRITGRVRLLNDAALVRWNMDKRYLAELGAEGLPVVPTRFLRRGERVDLAAAMAAAGWGEVVVKPRVSGAARETRRIARDEAAAHQPWLDARLNQEDMLLQPFFARVLREGERSIMVIDGVCTHGVRKRARPGDFRVQDDHGGTVEPDEVDAAGRALAERAVAACPTPPVYARVDLVPDEAGAPHIMELECVEPELFLRMHPPAAEALARAVARALDTP